MERRFEGHGAIVTGAAGGIGAAVARRLATEGAAITLADVSPSQLELTVKEIRDVGGKAHASVTDVRSREQVEQMVSEARAFAGSSVSLVVTCAGVVHIHPFLDLPEDSWDQTLAINLKGTFLVFQSAGRSMVSTGSQGRMVAISSVAGRGGRPTSADYAASKAGVISVVRSAALALAPHGITVNAVCPGVVDTEMTRANSRQYAQLAGITPEESLSRLISTVPLGRMETPDEVANVVAFLLSDEGGYVNGQAINVCGGLELD